ncbi:hypothetical protein N431DRAFT_177412 [Stipitochalara longipes BDJ]|nr:hypothetical protein N431DRAFT_177412 [Stipitochalara longipes BDJ]
MVAILVKVILSLLGYEVGLDLLTASCPNGRSSRAAWLNLPLSHLSRTSNQEQLLPCSELHLALPIENAGKSHRITCFWKLRNLGAPRMLAPRFKVAHFAATAAQYQDTDIGRTRETFDNGPRTWHGVTALSSRTLLSFINTGITVKREPTFCLLLAKTSDGRCFVLEFPKYGMNHSSFSEFKLGNLQLGIFRSLFSLVFM